MPNHARLLLSHLTLLAFLNACLPSTAYSAGPIQGNALKGGPYTLTEDMMESRAAEFVMRRFPGEHLIPVRILSGVKSPGTYYLPEGTDLITAIALSGGLTSTANPEKLHWNQWATQKFSMVDLQESVSDPKNNNPKLGANDVLMIDETKPWISNNTVLVIGLITGVLGIALSARALTHK